ncbi:HK97 gp10 family phage protein [Escherichia coli]|uniref:HK97 gp10 family phage protein n=1 Tax=Escherichia coli TaxID=562 RepID=UPI00164F68A0|nr:HK97 gp10 family phage protein [Escherichia coli]MBC6536813.1 HK97 gp10 family phage protein [Escherichia coli]
MPMKHKAVIEKIKRQLREEIKQISKDAATAAYEIATTAEAYAVLDTPRDTGALVNGYYVNVEENPDGAHATVGNTARYAFWVHEMPGTLKGQPREDFGKTREGIAFGGGTGKGCYWDPDADPKFLERALNDHKAEYMDIAMKYLKR